MRAIGFVVIALMASGGCGGAGDACATTYKKLFDSGVFGGQTYAGAALVFGMACKDMTAEDRKCLDGAKTSKDAVGCEHATTVLQKTYTDGISPKHGGRKERDREDATASLADAICGCRDLPCLAGIGSTHKDALPAMTHGDSRGPNRKRMNECLEKLSEPKKR